MTYPDTPPTLRLHFSDGFKYYGDATTITATATVNLPVPVARYLGDNTEIQDGQVLAGPLEDFRVPNPQSLGWTTTTGSRIRGWSYDLTVTVAAPGKPTVLWSATIRPANGVETITPGMGTIGSGSGEVATVTETSPGVYEIGA